MATAKIHVCALDEMERTVNSTAASHLVSLINQSMMPHTPAMISADRHLKLAMNDIGSPIDGFVAPSVRHIEQFIAFVDAWDKSTSLVVHCWAGISRSTAAAFIALCHLNPDCSEQAIAQMIRDRSPTASPNRLLVNCADKLLGRSGRLIEAIDLLGSADLASRGIPFSTCADLSHELPEADPS